jgi:diguanylate cyclase (GGDEF)-like protein
MIVSHVVGERLRATAIDAARQNAHGIVRGFVDPILSEESLGLFGRRETAIDEQLERLVVGGELERINIWSRDGRIVYSNDPALRGRRMSISDHLAHVFAGHTVAELSAEADAGSPDASTTGAHLEIYVPVRGDVDGDPIGVYEVYQDAEPLERQVAATRDEVFFVSLLGASVLLAILWTAFATGSRLLARQNRLLAERSRRDPLTGLSNHGDVLARIDRVLSKRRGRDGALAIVDVDNFRLLNDAHGYAAGDDALRAVAEELTSVAHPDQLFGRFGPDEFVVADLGGGTERLTSTLADLASRLDHRVLRYDGSEPLPVSVSSGVARTPRDGRRVLDLIGVAEGALREARTGGGHTVKIADHSTVDSLAAQNSTFGVLEGLLAIIDAKDHYTKAHAEDVTAHALLLAERIGLDADTRRTLRLACLLHDVGKVGIPDAILRKPGALEPHEREIMKQHVALGDAIVGAVPHLQAVREGVRHHHERWDGAGYIDGLRGERIPLIARVVAVADSYSAMTTTRPYRKALSPDVALERIAAAAGSQLDPELATTFVALMRERRGVAARPTPSIVDRHRVEPMHA